MPIYETYGIPFTSTITFQSPLLHSTQSPRLEIIEVPTALSLEGSTAFIAIEERHWNNIAPVELRRRGDADIQCFGDGAQIWIYPDRIIYAHGSTARLDLLDVRVVGVGFAWWLLRHGYIPLHAGALSLQNKTVLFTAESGMGKSSLMSSFVADHHPLVADDFVSLRRDTATGRVLASSAYPQMRLWGNSVSQFFGNPERHPTVFEDGEKRRVYVPGVGGHFHSGTYAVNRIYLLERQEATTGDIVTETLNGHEAFILLLSNIIMGAIVPTDYLQPILDTIQTGAVQVPFYRLSYPTGWEYLPAVRAAILAGVTSEATLSPQS